MFICYFSFIELSSARLVGSKIHVLNHKVLMTHQFFVLTPHTQLPQLCMPRLSLY